MTIISMTDTCQKCHKPFWNRSRNGRQIYCTDCSYQIAEERKHAQAKKRYLKLHSPH